jgi:predicted esterase
MIEYYRPNGPGLFPLVFMLHGSAGAFSVNSNDEPPVDNFGEKALARSCFAVVLPHYLEALGYKSLTSTQDMVSLFPQLFSTADTLLTDAETLDWVKGQPVFLFGESLGGYLSMALALRRSEVVAVSEISSGLPRGYTVERPHAFSILISHGTNDNLVPVHEAEELKRYCIQNNLQFEVDLYPDAGHYLSRPVQMRCLSHTIQFFLNRIYRG